MRNRERGSANWPFIISFVLLLVFGWLWFSTKGDADKQREEIGTLKKEVAAKETEIGEREALLDKISARVGFRNLVVQLGAGPRAWTRPEDLDGHLSENGMTGQGATQVPGLLNQLKTNAKVTIRQDLWKAGAPGTQVPVDLSKVTPEFKAKVQEVIAAQPKDPPTIPDDEDDAAAQAAYQAARVKYEEAVADYHKKLQELIAMKEWPAYSKVIAGTSLWDPDATKNTVDIVYYTKQPASPMTIQDLLGVPGPIIAQMAEALTVNMKGLLDTNDGLKKDVADREKSAIEVKDQLAAEQTAHTADVTKLTAERDEANARAEAARVAETNAQKVLATTKDNLERDNKKKDSVISAYQNKERIDKETRDLEIRRDDKDGEVLEASATLGTGYINLGASDKIFAGLRFNVSYIGRGGLRAYKGQVVVLKVLDAHYSQVSIVSQVSEEKPIGAGDVISNPFYSATRAIHVFLAGPLKKYPKAVAVTRLKQMNVVIDDAMSASTDYVVVPDTLTAKPAAPAAAGDAGAAPKGGEQSEYDKLAAMAHDFGASLMTERMLENFLEY